MKKINLAIVAALFLLAGCGNNDREAKNDYHRCNQDFAESNQCTEEEFREFLILQAEGDADIIGGLDDATGETQSKIIDEINEKVAEIF
jgi:hypothetical protein